MSDARETARLLVMRAAEWSRDNRGRGEHLSFNTQDLRDRIALVAERPATTSASDFAERPDRLASIRERLGKATPGPARRRSHLELSPADRDFIANAREDMAWLLAHFPAPMESSAGAAPDGATPPGMEEAGRPITPEDTLKCTEGGPGGATAPGAGTHAYGQGTCKWSAAEHCDYPHDACKAAPPAAGSREARLRAATEEVVGWAQGVLTALNVGDVQSESDLHKKLREVMIAYRSALAPAPEPRPHGNATP